MGMSGFSNISQCMGESRYCMLYCGVITDIKDSFSFPVYTLNACTWIILYDEDAKWL